MSKLNAVKSAQLRQLFSVCILALVTSTVLAAILAFIQRWVIPSSTILSWFSLVLLVATCRTLLVYFYRRALINDESVDTWLFRFRLGVLAVGVVWGAAGYLMFPVNNVQHQMFLIFMLAGLSAGGVISYSADLVCSVLFSITTLLPVSIRFLLNGDNISMAMGISGLLYLGYIILSLRFINRTITENILLRHEAVTREEMLRISAIAFESQSGMIVTSPDTVILRVNQAFTSLTGYSAQEIIGQTPRIFSSGRHDKAYFEALWSNLKDTGYWQGKIWNRHKNGTIEAVWLTISAVIGADNTVTHYVGTYSDINENKDAVAEIHRLAYYDTLTQLPNRRFLQERLGQELAASNRTGLHGAILFLDLDGFKTLNDTRGHNTGDMLLVEVAKRLQAVVREVDFVGRLGGDEFVVLLENLSADAEIAAMFTQKVGEKLLEALAQPYIVDGYEFHCSASIGIRLYREQETVEDMLRHADLAMYQAKQSGRNALRFFDPTMQTIVTVRADMEKDLRQALEQNQFKLYFQPQIYKQRQITGAEVLLRWHHPERGLMLPVDFIPLAEKNNLILPIGDWVLASTCNQLRAWGKQANTRNLQLAVNVSARQFKHPDFVGKLQQLLASNSISPGLLKLELTESLILDNIDDTLLKMTELRELGVGISLDDFGTGYSSFSYLTQLQLDQIKIDRSFIKNIGLKSNDSIIVQTIIGMAHNLGLDVIAEGVETEAQHEFLNKHGCFAYQGFLFSAPLTIEELEKLVTSLQEA